MATLNLQHIDKIYDNNVQAVFDFNLDVKDGELIVLVGGHFQRQTPAGRQRHHSSTGQGQRHGNGIPELRPVRPHDHL